MALDPLTIEASPLSYLALAAARRLEAALRRGFTTVRDVAGCDPGLAPGDRERPDRRAPLPRVRRH